MRLSLDLPDETVRNLERQASATGRSIEELVSAMLDLSIRLAHLGMPGDSESDNGPESNGPEARIAQERRVRAKMAAEESLRRMNDFDSRKDQFIAAIRKGKG